MVSVPAGSRSDGPAGPAALQGRGRGPDLPVCRLHPGQVLPGVPRQQPDPHRTTGGGGLAGEGRESLRWLRRPMIKVFK